MPKTRRRPSTEKLPKPLSATSRAKLDLDSREQEMAVRRMGRTSEDRLRWLVSDFATKDLDALRAEELTALGYDLRQLLSPPWGVSRRHGPLPPDDVRRIQREVAKGLRILSRERRTNLDEGWELPSGTDRVVPWFSGDEGKRNRAFTIRSSGDEYTVIIRGIANLIVKAGSRLRECERCQTPFVAVKRQEYCGSACSQQARDQRKREKRQPKR